MLKYFLLILICTFLSLGLFLDITVPPKKSDIIISLGSNDLTRIAKSLDLLEKSYATQNKIYYFGRENELAWHIRKDEAFKKAVKKHHKNIVFIHDIGNTMQEVIYIKNLLDQYNYQSVIIVTSPTHSRRVDLLIQHLNQKLGSHYAYIIVSSQPQWWNKYTYFMNLKALGLSLLETNKLIFNFFKYTFLEDSTLIESLNTLSDKIKTYLYKNYDL